AGFVLSCLAIGALALVIALRPTASARTVRVPLSPAVMAAILVGLLVVLATIRPLTGLLQRTPAIQQIFELTAGALQPLATGVVGALVLAVAALVVAVTDGPAVVTAW